MDLIQEQLRRNAAADDAWELYAPHRTRVTQLLLETRRPNSGRLCLLGAGNLNDFDLSALAAEFSEIVLVDVDAEALQRGLARQGFAESARVRLIAPMDLTGVFADLSGLTKDEAIDRCLGTLTRTPDFGERSSCEVVASVGLLTQLIDGVTRSVGESHPRYWEIVSAVRAQHLRLMLELTCPGGSAVLITEVVSSDSCPPLLSSCESDLPAILPRELAARNFFTGTNPVALQQLLRTERGIAEQLASFELRRPWLWRFFVRTYAVYAVMMRKRS